MTKPKFEHLHKLGKLVSLLLSACASLVLLAFTWQAFALPASLTAGDPDIQSVQIEAAIPLYNLVDVMHTVYFDNSTEGIITTSLEISGTPTLTLTAVPAFGQPGSTYTFTTISGLAVITYPVALEQVSQPGVQYTLVNTDEVAATAVISYLLDITQPISTLDNLPFGGLVITTSEPTLLLTGTVGDDQSGVKSVMLDPGTGILTPANLADTGDRVQNTTWNYTWTVPTVESGIYTLYYYAEDNIGQEEPAHAYTVTVDNDPVANDDVYSTDKNIPLDKTVDEGVLDNDTDPRGRTLTAVLVSPPANGGLSLRADGSFVYTPTTDFVGNDTFTYKANNGSKNSNTATVTITVIETDSYIYLPLVIKPHFEASGEINFVETDRFAGITTFKSSVPLDFSGIRFNYTPQEMKLWVGANEPTSGWQSYTLKPVFLLNTPLVGGQDIHVRFRYGAETVLKSTIFFYIPNGDFLEGAANWSPKDNGLQWSVVNNHLRLGSDAYGCNAMPFPASASASTTLSVPSDGYKLYVEAFVYTYDKLPDPSQGVYDAFEIHANNQIKRYGYSGLEKLNCSTQRTVQVDSSVPLSSGSQPISLENHSRFDNYYNTYTDVIKVWVDR